MTKVTPFPHAKVVEHGPYGPAKVIPFRRRDELFEATYSLSRAWYMIWMAPALTYAAVWSYRG
jgi:hypothetical protein